MATLNPSKINQDLVRNKDEDKDSEENKIKNNSCNKCRALRLPSCKCRRPGGGGNSGGDGSETKGDDNQADNKSELPEHQVPKNRVSGMQKISAGGQGSAEDLESLSYLVYMSSLLLININWGRGILEIKPKPGLLFKNEQIPEYLLKIKEAFEQFRDNLEKQGVPVDNFTCVFNNNELLIRVPSPRYFDAFIADLVDKKLVPNEKTNQNDAIHKLSLSPTPFAVAPTPSVGKKEEEEQRRSSLSPFSLELTPKLPGE